MPSAQIKKTKEFLDDLLLWLSGQGKILIVVHDNPDPDCLASAMALRHLFMIKLNRDATMCFSGMIGRSENLAMAKELEIPLVPFEIVDLADYQVLCMLDTQPETGNNSLPSGTRVDLVIDHHPQRPATMNCRWVDVREEYGVTATIVYEYLVAQQVPIGTKLATALFYAIKSETQDLGREAGRVDRDAYHQLFPLVNKKLLHQITHPPLPLEYYRTLYQSLSSAMLYGSVLVADASPLSFPETVAEMADFFVRLEGLETALCVGTYNREIILSIRTKREDLNAGEAIRRIVSGFGCGGGHGMTAGGKIVCDTCTDEEIARIKEAVAERFVAEFSSDPSEPAYLLSGR